MKNNSTDRHHEPFPDGAQKKTLFALLLLAGSIVSTIFHELGHCIAYWVQGVPASLSLTKEFPLRNITAQEFAIGSAGGPAMTVVVTIVTFWLYARAKNKSRGKNSIVGALADIERRTFATAANVRFFRVCGDSCCLSASTLCFAPMSQAFTSDSSSASRR